MEEERGGVNFALNHIYYVPDFLLEADASNRTTLRTTDIDIRNEFREIVVKHVDQLVNEKGVSREPLQANGVVLGKPRVKQKKKK